MTGPGQDDPARLSRLTKVLVAAVLLVFGGLIVVNLAMYISGHLLLRKQSSAGAFACTCSLVEDFIRTSDPRRWPSSWDDLDGLPARDFNSIAWPRDKARFVELVEIDFRADLGEVARQNPESFTAIRPRYPSTLFPTAPVSQRFIETLSRPVKP